MDIDKNTLQKVAIETGENVAVNALRKLVAAKLVADGKKPDDATSIADRGIHNAIAAHNVGSGKWTVENAVDKLVDRAAAITSVWLQKNGAELVEKGCACAGAFIGAKLTPVFGPKAVKIGYTVGKVVGKAVGKVATKVIDEGIKKIVPVAKSVCRQAVEGVKTVAKKAWNKVTSFLGGLFG